MSLDPGNLARSSSPASSEASLPKHRNRMHEDELKTDKAYRRYASNVERALSLFDTALQEWADYISFLSRLLKALQSHPPPLSTVPQKALVAKRLAQCLNPSLPSGVHQKTLEVYAYIFALLKPDDLARDLPLYLPGIAPTLTFASLSVRPLVLSLFEQYIVKIDPICIRPALKAILLALLPGLEEEASEDFEATLGIVNKFREVSNGKTDEPSNKFNMPTGSQYFWQCLFLASITNPTRRMGVLAYLNRNLPKLGGDIQNQKQQEEVELSVSIKSLTSPEPGLLIRCFATGLADSQLLVQRNYLDLLVTHLPLHSSVLESRIIVEDLELLVAAAAGVVIRKDMSLNRRLWAWFLGPDSAYDGNENVDELRQAPRGHLISKLHKGIPSSEYFLRFGLKPLVNSIRQMIRQNSMLPQERAKPFRISLSLMDRWEVGGLVVPEVFLPIMRSVQQYDQIATSKSMLDEVIRSASAFFDGVESSLIFSELLSLVFQPNVNNTSSKNLLLDLQLGGFILSHFNIREEEMLITHVPLLLLGVLLTMRSLSSVENFEEFKLAFDEASSIARDLLSFIPSRAFIKKLPHDQHPSQQLADISSITPNEISTKLIRFYSITRNTLENPTPPFAPNLLAELLLRQSCSQVLNTLKSGDRTFRLREQVNFLISLLKKAPKSHIFEDGDLYESIHDVLSLANQTSMVLSMTTLSSMCSIVTSLYSIHSSGLYISYDQVCDIVPSLVQQLWELLPASSPKFHVEAARCFWVLHSITWQDHLVEAAVTSLMLSCGTSSPSCRATSDQVERFLVLWNHSHGGGRSASRAILDQPADPTSTVTYRFSLLERPLFLSLDLLSSESGRGHSLVKQWLQDPSVAYQYVLSYYSIDNKYLLDFRALHILVSRLLKFPSFKTNATQEPHDLNIPISSDDGGQCLYLLKTISNAIASLTNAGWSALTSKPLVSPSKHAVLLENEEEPTLQGILARIAMQLVEERQEISKTMGMDGKQLPEAALILLNQLLSGSNAEALQQLNLDTFFLDQLLACLDQNETGLQSPLLDAILPALKVRFAHETRELSATMASNQNQRKSSIEAGPHASRLSLTGEQLDKDFVISQLPQPPPQLLLCLTKGICSKSTKPIVDKWVHFLGECLPLYLGIIFQVLLKLVDCICKEINAAFNELRLTFQQIESSSYCQPEHVTISLLSALENCIATGHDRLLLEEANASERKSLDQPQSFFGNMVSGVFAAEASQSRSATANDRLTVLLCFQDAVRLCFSIWTWGDNGRGKDARKSECHASFQFISLRMRNRSRRILEHMFTAETLDCLETLIELWCTSTREENHPLGRSVFNLLHTLEGSKPKIAVPALFNAIYSRTNPAALDPSRKSAMTAHLTEADLATFLVVYARSLDEDMLDEIWADCTTFLRDVLANPFPHRQILPRLLEFATILGEKMENTTFGEDYRAKKDLGDILLRLLTAISTSKPMGFSQETVQTIHDSQKQESTISKHRVIGSDDVYSVLYSVLPALTTTLGDADRIGSAVSNISTHFFAPLFHSRLFPQNVNSNILALLQQVSKVPSASKYWRKDVADAFNDPKFFAMKLNLVKDNWLDLLRQWTLTDKERLPDLLTRLTQPTSAGLMFGVGASAARLDADRKSQLNLRRIALLILTADEDHFSGDLSALQQKLEDLLAATDISSPSAVTRAEIYMVFRALILKTSTIHLAPFWPMINAELQDVISTIPCQRSETYTPYSLLQACKLLETLLLTSPDDFQLQEWLFVTDTIDVIYPPDYWKSAALADEVARALSSGNAESTIEEIGNSEDGFHQLWLSTDLSRETAKDEIVERLLRPFFARLSIHAFESIYSMANPDWPACKNDLLADLFNDFTIAS
ncbi:hypothetical protein LOZ65_003513 [Ophidiomyces ophidiicola]|nr:hypothetical protein LOZ65_003513 [Ophidiomyces ophidiicola]